MAHILQLPAPDSPYEIHCDASNFGSGAVLLQYQQLELATIAYGSKSLSPEERNSTTTERECLAAIKVALLLRESPH